MEREQTTSNAYVLGHAQHELDASFSRSDLLAI